MNLVPINHAWCLCDSAINLLSILETDRSEGKRLCRLIITASEFFRLSDTIEKQ